jgi:peptidoglycan/LPS O-acetylase OafA/YrhL
MGALRLLLAFSVFNGHAGLPLGFSIVSGATAVHCFFVISGFYMAMVLTEKYGCGSAAFADFITSRLMRLAPGYLVVLLLTVAAIGGASRAGLQLPPLTAALAVDPPAPPLLWLAGLASQVTLLGQDQFFFWSWSHETGLHWSPQLQQAVHPLHELLLIPPAWSLALELYFYLLAPFLVKRSTRALAVLVALSLLGRFALAWSGLRADPWSYRFFPSELAFFVSGMLVYRASRNGQNMAAWLPLAGLGAMLGFAELVGVMGEGNLAYRALRVVLFASLLAGIAPLFRATARWKWDTWLGGLSYPLYVSHVLVIWCVSAVAGAHADRAFTITAVIGVAVLLKHLVDDPLDRYRQAVIRTRIAAHAGSRQSRVAGARHAAG